MSTTLQFKYSKKQLRSSLLFGILWIVIFALYFFFRTESYFGYGYLAIGIIYIGTYLYKKNAHYAIIKDGIFTKNGFFPKQINLSEITNIHYFSGQYRLISNNSEITINTMVIDKTAIEDFKKLTTQLNLSKP